MHSSKNCIVDLAFPSKIPDKSQSPRQWAIIWLLRSSNILVICSIFPKKGDKFHVARSKCIISGRQFASSAGRAQASMSWAASLSTSRKSSRDSVSSMATSSFFIASNICPTLADRVFFRISMHLETDVSRNCILSPNNAPPVNCKRHDGVHGT